MPKRREAQDDAMLSWHSGRPSSVRQAAADDLVRERYGVEKPDVVEEFLRERALDDLLDGPDGECPCGSGASYSTCHGLTAPS